MKMKLLNMLTTFLVVFIVSVSAHSMNEVLTKQGAEQLSEIVVEGVAYTDSQLSCLADNIYFEARGQGKVGWLAVAFVTVNRMNDSRYPNTICKVVHQAPTRESWKKNGKYYPIRNQCQFSWYCDGKHDTPYPGPTWKKTQQLAEYYMQHKHLFKDITDGATHYHADYIDNPRWSKFLEKTVKIDTHIFYR